MHPDGIGEGKKKKSLSPHTQTYVLLQQGRPEEKKGSSVYLLHIKQRRHH